MKKILFTLLVSLIFNFQNSIHLYSQWVELGNVNTTQLNCVKFFDQITGVTCGVGGIWRTTNSGFNWVQVLTGPNLNSISFTDYNNGLAVGDSGKIFKTTNNGLNWTILISNTQLNFYGVSYPTSLVGYIVGQTGIILKTINSGTNWTTQITTGNDFNCIKMQNASTGYACGGSGRQFVFSTGNGGYNWVGSPGNTGPSLRSIDAVGLSLVITVGENGRIWKSTNNGAYWSYPSSNTTVNLNSVVLTNPYVIYICGNSGKMLISTNSGDNWAVQTTNTQSNLNCLSFINSNTGWAVGQNGIVVNIGLQVGVSKLTEQISLKFKLYQNYPNPFNPTTKIKFNIPLSRGLPAVTSVQAGVSEGRGVFTTLIIYDILGREITTLVNQKLKPGTYEVEFDGTNYTSGVYFYKLSAEEFTETKKLVLLK